MNYILSVVFLICIFSFYFIIGDNILYYLGSEKNNNNIFLFKIVSGWIVLFFVSWVVGFPCQLFSVSWRFYEIIYSMIMVILLLICFILLKKRNKLKLENRIFNKVSKHLARYWFVYLLAIIFTSLSVFNLQVYRLDNYTDDHYIVKVLNLIGSKHLLDKDYFYGNLLYNAGKFSYVKQHSYTVLNTYELTYSYFSNLFHIYPVVFCRFAMTIHNYLILSFCFQAFSSLFLDESISQYALILLPIFFIPSGYLAKANVPIKIRMWENWRTQTAIYMGSSIVRLGFLPLSFYLFYNDILSSKKSRVAIYVAFLVTFISYQTTAVSYILLIIPILLVIYTLNFIGKNIDFSEKSKVYFKVGQIFLILSIFLGLAFLSDSLLNIIKSGDLLLKYENVYNNYIKYYNNVYSYDTFAKYFLVGAVLCFFLYVKDNKLRNLIIGCILIYIIFTFKFSKVYIGLISQESYCIARMLTSILMLSVIIIGVDFIKIISIGFKGSLSYTNFNIIVGLVVSFSVALSLIYIKNNYTQILQYNETGDAIIKDGYSIETIMSNDEMIPDMFKQVGDYINKHERGKIAIFSEEKIKYKGKIYSNQNLLLASTKIQHVNYISKSGNKKDINKMKIMNGCNWVLTQYSKNVSYYTYEKILPFIDKAKLKYIFTTRQRVMDELSKRDFKIVVKGKKFWLLKRN